MSWFRCPWNCSCDFLRYHYWLLNTTQDSNNSRPPPSTPPWEAPSTPPWEAPRTPAACYTVQLHRLKNQCYDTDVIQLSSILYLLQRTSWIGNRCTRRVRSIRRIILWTVSSQSLTAVLKERYLNDWCIIEGTTAICIVMINHNCGNNSIFRKWSPVSKCTQTNYTIWIVLITSFKEVLSQSAVSKSWYQHWSRYRPESKKLLRLSVVISVIR